MLIHENLYGYKVELRNIKVDDANDMYLSWLNDVQVNQYLETRWQEQSIEKLRNYVEMMIASPNDIMLAIEMKQGKKHVGNIKIGHIDFNNKQADIGYFIGDKDCWGRGLATEAVKLASDYAFSVLGMHRVFAGIIDGNIASAKVLENCGFHIDAIIKEACYWGGHFVSHIYYGKVSVL